MNELKMMGHGSWNVTLKKKSSKKNGTKNDMMYPPISVLNPRIKCKLQIRCVVVILILNGTHRHNISCLWKKLNKEVIERGVSVYQNIMKKSTYLLIRWSLGEDENRYQQRKEDSDKELAFSDPKQEAERNSKVIQEISQINSNKPWFGWWRWCNWKSDWNSFPVMYPHKWFPNEQTPTRISLSKCQFQKTQKMKNVTERH